MDRLAAMEPFIRVVETGSFSGAARHLRVGQPAISKTIAQLESYLGVKLLTRSTRGLTPTEAGLGYLELGGGKPRPKASHNKVDAVAIPKMRKAARIERPFLISFIF
jgi:hypothetical protein